LNTDFDQAEDLISEIADKLEEIENEEVEVVICPPFLYLEMATDIASESVFKVGAHNMSQFESGAYNGEVSAAMLASVEVDYCIIGHSERRKYFSESNQTLALKVDLALKHRVLPIFCCGEILAEREAGHHFDVVKEQLEQSLFHLDADQFDDVVIAYEPVWAIGTGVTASPAQAQEMHAYIRNLIGKKYNTEVAEETTILYGGSCNSGNARELFAQKDVDGGLIGGASLKADEFVVIINSF
jgi:triosephosphate isomerase